MKRSCNNAEQTLGATHGRPRRLLRKIAGHFPIAPLAAALVLASCGPTPPAAVKTASTASAPVEPVAVQAAMTPEALSSGINFYAKDLPGYVASVRGLAEVESFGRWSIAKLVLIDFVGPLPAEFDLQLVFGGFGPNVGAELQAIVGAEAKAVRIKSDLMQMQTYQLRFANPGRSSSVALIVPAPTSPQAIGKSANDPRMLGIALQSMVIRSVETAEPQKK